MVASVFVSFALSLLASLLSGATGQCPTGTRLTPRAVSAEIGGRVTFRCYDAATEANLNDARFFKDGALITIDGSKYANSLSYVLDIDNIELADEGDYTCLPPQSPCGDGASTAIGSLLVQPQLATNPQQDYVAFLGENIDLDCGLQFGRLMTTRFIEWRTASGEILASTGNPGSPGDRYQFNRQTFQLTIERVPLSAELLSPFDGYICRTTGSSLLATQTNLDASEVYLTVEDEFSISVDATSHDATLQFPNRAPDVRFNLLFYALPEGSNPSGCSGREPFHQVTLDPASDVAVNIGGDVEAEVPAGLYIIAARVAVNGEEGDCRSTSGSIIYGTRVMPTGSLSEGVGGTGLSVGALVGIIIAVVLGVLILTAICIAVAYLCRRSTRSEKRFTLSTKPPPLSPEEGGTMERRTDTLEKKAFTSSLKGSLFSINKQHVYNASDFELSLDNGNMYVDNLRERNTSVSESWCYSPKLQTFPRTSPNSAQPPNGGAPRYPYETATLPAHDNERPQMEHPLHQLYDRPRNHPVDSNKDEHLKMNTADSAAEGGEGRKSEVGEASNYEVPVSCSDLKARVYRSQTPSPETPQGLAEGGDEALEDEGSEDDVLTPPVEFNVEDNPLKQGGGLAEEDYTSTSQSTDFDTREGATFV